MFLVTGGAGFIGSNVVASLNEAGATDVVVNDLLGKEDAKWRNLAKRQVADLVPPSELMAWLDGRKLPARRSSMPRQPRPMATVRRALTTTGRRTPCASCSR